MIVLTLPYPISANRYWRSFVPKGHSRAIVTLSDEAKAYKEQVAWAASRVIREPFDVRCALHLQLYPKRPQDWAKRARRDPLTWDDDVQSLDLDNAQKVLIDALKGIAFVDDSRRYVRRLLSEHMEPDAGEARVVVTITPLALPLSPQADLLGAAA